MKTTTGTWCKTSALDKELAIISAVINNPLKTRRTQK